MDQGTQLFATDDILDGQPDAVVRRRTSVKLADKPQIAVAIPVGGKPIQNVLPCPKCGIDYAVDTGFVIPAHVPAAFLLSHMNWIPPLNAAMTYMIRSGLRSPHARQIMTMEAIRQDAKYIFYVDDDTLVPPMGLYTLHNFMERNPDAGAVGGIYTSREDPPEPFVYRSHGEGAAWDIEMGPGATPEKVLGLGAGCLMARVEAIKDWMSANPNTPIWADQRDVPADPNDTGGRRVMWGHDIRFCVLLTEHGWPVYADGRVLCEHYDAATNRVFRVPTDAPGFKIRGGQKQE
jgi:hypothetical protein